ncbi:MAG: hypothetical protein JNM21_08035 [Taibaiella sp.]|nr:hypothetical protein [Taibaiella sp.]
MKLANTIKKYLVPILGCLLLLLPATVRAQTFTFDTRDQGAAHTALQVQQHGGGFPDTIDVHHDKWDDIRNMGSGWRNVIKFKSLQSYVRFSVLHKPGFKVTSPYKFKVSYQVRGYANPLDTNSYTTLYDTLSISYSPDSLAAYQDVSMKRYTGFHRLKVIFTALYEIQNATSPPVLVDMTPNAYFSRFNFQVEAGIIPQPYIKQVRVGATYHPVYGIAANALNIVKGTVNNNVLPVKWNIAGLNIDADAGLTPVNYELEWQYVDNYKVTPGDSVVTEKDIAALKYDFKHNSTRVTVNRNHFDIPLIYQKGYVVYRVRMVRPDSVLYRYPVYGQWSMPNESGSLSSLSTDHYYKITAPHNNDSLNWQYTISFAEQGKYKHVLSYYDGMLKNRQSITRFNSMPGKLIATEQVYDHEGRPSLSILPTPVNSTGFNYQYGLALNSATGLPYKAADFDHLNNSCAAGDVLIDSLATGALSRMYYSSSNTDTAGFQKFVPHAEGYPLVQTIYSPGFEDRVDKQGGAGLPLQIGKGHGTKNNYVSADQADLNRMFGLNVGLSGFYRKTVTKDPNGQLSLNYTDFRGKTVASSLVGIPDTTSLALLPNTNVPDTTSFEENHLAGMQQQYIGNAKILDKVYFNDVAGNNRFKYTTTFTPFPTYCPDKFLSVKANYWYTVADECGAVQLRDTGSLGTTGVLNTATLPPLLGATRNVFLESGAHAIHKELTYSPDDLIAAVDSYMVLPDNCLRTEQDFIKEEVLSRTFPCATCKTLCDELRDDLKKELWPNYNGSYSMRKYGYYTDSTGAFSSNNNSIFTLLNNSGSGSSDIPDYNPLYNHYRYQDTCLVTLPDTVIRFGQVYTNLRALPVDTFIAIFNDTIAEALLPLHPEYCELLKCAVDTFQDVVNSLPDAVTAENMGLLYLNDIIQRDPVYQHMVQAGISGAMDSLSKMKYTGFSLDSMALLMAYCEGGDPVMFSSCVQEIFKDSIDHSILLNPYVKERYLQRLKAIYFTNRQRHISFLTPLSANPDCSRCLPVRMTLIGEGNFENPIDFSNPYMGNPFGISTNFVNQLPPAQAAQVGGFLGSFSGLDSAFAAAMDSLHNNPNSNYSSSGAGYLTSFPSMSSAYNTALGIYNNGDSLITAGAVNAIMEKLVNCADSVSMQAVRNRLMELVTGGQVVMAKFTPEHVRWALQTSGIALTDLCHPYLPGYENLAALSESKFTCMPGTRYTELGNVLDLQASRDALANIGVEYTLNLPAGNAVAQQIYNRLATSGTIKVQAQQDTARQLYTLHFYQSTITEPQAVVFYFKNFTSCAQPFNASGGNNIAIKADCISDFEHLNADVEGYIGAYLFYARAIKGTADTCHMVAWSNLVETNNINTGNIAACIPCTEMHALYDAFVDTMDSYGLKHVDHPYYEQSLRGFMNYNLKRVYGTGEYLNFMESCALADHRFLPLMQGYATVFFNNFSEAAVFLGQLQNLDASANIQPLFRYRYGSSDRLIFDFRLLPEKNWRIYKHFINNYSSSVEFKAVNNAFLSVDNTPGLLGILETPAPPSATAISDIQNLAGITVYYAGNVQWFNGSGFQDMAASYVVKTGATPAQISQGLAKMQQYLFDQGINGYMINQYQHTVNHQYYLPEKAAYLDYVNQFNGMRRSLVLDTLRPEVLAQQVPLYNGMQLSYGTLTNLRAINNLYSMHPQNDTAGTQNAILNLILAKATMHFGGQRLFSTAQTTHIEPNQKLILYRNSDNMFWYRYFGPADQLYNVYVLPPKYMNAGLLAQYGLHSIQLMPGDTGSTSFKLTLYKPGATPEYVTVNGYTDFKIGNNKVLHDVLLPSPYHNPEEDILMNCERYRLDAAIYEGQVRYIHYRDSIRNRLINDFTAHVLQGMSETLVSSYKTQRFNYTLYEYDRAQNLVRTVPPAGVNFLSGTPLGEVDNRREAGSNEMQYLPQHNKGSKYQYNTLNQVVLQETPDGGKTRFFYDGAGRVIFSQNDQQQLTGRMTYTLYDAQSRIMETGQAKIACDPYFPPFTGTTVPASYTCGYNVGGIITPFPPQVQDAKSYSNEQVIAFVRSLAREDVVLTQYDNAVINLGNHTGMSPQDNLRKRVASVKFFTVLSAGNTAFSDYDYAMHFSYDIAGNVKTLTRDYPAWAPAGQRFKRVDYDYDLISGKVNLLSYNRGFADQFYQKYSYDDDNRITTVNSSQDGMIWARDAAYEYYQHGPLARMSLGEWRVQGVDYAYTIQGWLKAINGDILNPEKDMGNDAIGNSSHASDAVALSIDYFNGDYKPIGNTPATNAAPNIKSLYNGNIPRTSAGIKPFDNLSTAYTYDQLNRILKADYAQLLPDAQLVPTQQFYNSYAYDPDGNLQKLVRNGNHTGTLAMDSIVYRYTAGNQNNRLINVNDYVADNYSNDIKQNTITNVSRYLYDRTGNLVKDLVSGQDTIQWNHYNKVTSVMQGGPDSSVLRFDYDGMGQRYMKTYVSAVNDTTVEKGEYYVRDAQGNILAIYKAESRYELSPVTVWENVIQPAISYVGPAAFINNFLTPAYSNNALYQNYMISTGVEAGVPAQLMGNYTPATLLSGNHALYSGFLSSAEYSGELFQSLREHAEYELGGVSPLSMIVQERSRKDEVYNGKLVQALFGPDAPDEVRQESILALLATDGPARNLFEALSLSYDEVDPQQNVNLLMERLRDSKAYGDFTRAFHEHIVRAEGMYSAPFYEGLAMNTVLQSKDVLDNYAALMNVWQLGMIQYGYTSELDSFVNSWGATNDVLTQTVAPEVLGNAIYSLDPGPFVQSAYDLSGSNNAVLFGGLNAVYQGSFGINIAHIQDLLQTHLQYQVPVTTWQNLLKYQHLNLASHHLYGSSRLGTKDYLEGQLYAKVDLTGSQPFMDTLMLTARRPWYSMDYDELITGAGQTPWGMAATEPYHFAAQIGQKQYELSNHLGNVQATVSDLPYMATFTQANTDVPGVKYEPSLRSAYDYYPFGMLMPGRYVSDTIERCMTISRTGWSSILVDSCWPLAVMYVQSHTTGGGSISHTGGNLVLSAPLAGDAVSIAMQVASGVENTFEFDVSNIAGAPEEGVLVSVLETIDNVPYVIGGGRLQLGGKQKINFRSFGNNVSLLFTGPLDVMEIAKVCTKYPKSVQHTYLVDVCDESKDRYRFGFNGQEKVNEIAGVGNHNTAQFWEYDTRLGRRWNLDPVDQVGISNYAVNFLNPITHFDPNGDHPLVYVIVDGIIIATATVVTVKYAYDINKQILDQNHFYNNQIDNVRYSPAMPAAAKPANFGATKIQRSNFQKLTVNREGAQSRVSNTPQKAKQASANSGHTKSKAAPVRPKSAPTSQPKPEIRLAEQNEEPQPQNARLSPEAEQREGNSGQRRGHTPDQQALNELVKEQRKTREDGSLTNEEADNVLELAEEVNRGSDSEIKSLDHRFDSGNNDAPGHWGRDPAGQHEGTNGHIHHGNQHIKVN